MKAVQIPKPGAEFQIVERDIPVPGAREVRIKVQACGVCHSDSFTKEGQWPGIQYPRVPGHEVVGKIDEVGPGISEWKMGSAWGWAGTAAMTTLACSAGAAISVIVRMRRFPESAMTVDIRSTCWLLRRHW